jgi:hypothetical protein
MIQTVRFRVKFPGWVWCFEGNDAASVNLCDSNDSHFLSFLSLVVTGSETYQGQSIDLVVTTPLSPALGAVQAKPTQLDFASFTGVTVDNSTPDLYKLSGNTIDLEAALASLTLAPGLDNGENITVQVTVTSQESNPTESGKIRQR